MTYGGGTFLHVGAALAVLAAACEAAPVTAQEWNGTRALELVARARAVREGTVTEQGLESYSADARGYVYFFVDHEGSEERNLVRTDQVALEVYWRAPNQSRQRIIGLRDEEQLPSNIQYHLDHLTVVQDDFGDRMRLGDGDEVSDVLHPLAPGSESVYEFALGDSLEIRFAGLSEPIRVYEVRVRPVDLDAPGFVGTVFVDRATAAVVRMRFTFTPASYVDPYLDYIRISLDNGLWEGRYWLPYEQLVEIRREAPIVEFPMGSVIRGRYRISGYRLNEPLPPELFQGPRVTAVPEARRRAFPFERDLYAEIEQEGLGPAPDLDAIRNQAVELAHDRYLSGLGPFRLYTPGVSSLVRYNRAEGTVLGIGMAYRPSSSLSLRLSGAYSFGRERVRLRARVDGGDRWPRTRAVGFLDEARDIGPVQASSGVGNSLSSLIDDRDYQDLYFASGIEVSQGLLLSDSWNLEVGARWERHRTATDVVTGSSASAYRPVRSAQEGDLLSLDVRARWGDDQGLAADGEVRASTFEGNAFGVFKGGLSFRRDWLAGRRAALEGRLEGGIAGQGAPAQSLFLLGGRSTIPGFDFRSFEGDRYWFARADGTLALVWPWVSGRAFVAAGGTHLGGDPLPGWSGQAMDAPRASVGLGLDLFWEVVRLELGRGVGPGSGWELNFFASKRFWPVL